MNIKMNDVMNYNQPFQHLSFVASKSKDAIYLRSKVMILAKAGTTFSKTSVTDYHGNLIDSNDPSVTSFMITYKEVTDQSRTSNSYFSDITDIVLLENVSLDFTDTQESIKKLIYEKFKDGILFKVLARVLDSGPTGNVTTTLTEKSDIEIV